MNQSKISETRKLVPQAPDYLRQKVELGEVVPFIGAGISMGAELPKDFKMPSYKTLLKKLLNAAKPQMSEKIHEECSNLLENGEFMVVADMIETSLSTADLYILLRDQLNHLQPKPSLVHELLNLFNFEIIFTSNYDRLLETSLFPTPEVVTYQDSVSLSILRREKKPFIFKIHGDLTRPETIVLGWSKYRELHGKKKNSNKYQDALRSFIQSTLLEKTLLFLGCSFADSEYAGYFFNFSKTFKTTGKHYALVEKGSISEDRKRIWHLKMGVEILEFEPDETYSQVWEFLSSLKPQKAKVVPSAGSPFENFYLLKERPDYLKQQLVIETQALSCRYITPGITNCLADEAYIKIDCDKKLEKFRNTFDGDFEAFKTNTLNGMLLRAKNIEEKLKENNFEFRAIFLMEEVEKELNEGGEIIKKRYDYILNLSQKYGDKLHLRMYKGGVSHRDYMKSTYALIFYGDQTPDIAYFYAPQATSNKFTAHMLQINTRPVMERVEHFERFWVNSISEKDTIEILKTKFQERFG